MQMFLYLAFFSTILHHSAASSRLRLPDGISLKAAAVHAPPYDILTRNPDGNYTLSGTGMSTWDWLSKRVNFAFSIEPVEASLIAKLGIYEGAISKVVNKEVDGLAVMLIVTPERKAKTDFTFMAWSEPYTLVVPKPEQLSRLFAFIRPFQPTVWLILAITVVIIIVMMSAFSWFYIIGFRPSSQATHNYKREEINPGSCIKDGIHNGQFVSNISYFAVYVVNVLTNHGIYTPHTWNSFRVLAGCWLLAALVLVNSYSSIVVSSLTVPVMKPSVNSFEDLASNEEVSLILREDIIIGRQIMNASTGVLKSLADRTRQHTDRLFTDNPSLFKKLDSGHYAYPFIRSFNRDFITKKFREEGKCRFQLSDPLYQLSSGHFTILLQKNLKYTSILNLAMTHFWETGFVHHWVQQLTISADQCFIKNKKSLTPVAVGIKLEDLISAFFVLGSGIGLSMFSFLVEIIFGVLCHSKTK